MSTAFASRELIAAVTLACAVAKALRAFVNSSPDTEPDQALISQLSNAYLGNNYNNKVARQTLFNSPQFRDSRNFYQRYSWPAEFVVRAIKETGWVGFTVGGAITPTTHRGPV